jgi:predicted glycoside hydrolase/deacetylase ChbG (UPF0249 family)
MKRLLVNADDFGLHADIDAGIVDCIDAGRVCSISFSPNGKSLDWERLAELKAKGVLVGLHLTLVGEPWLSDGRVISKWPELGSQIFTGGGAFREQLGHEIEAQFAACDARGLKLDHVDSHQHVHIFGAVWRPTIAAARSRAIGRVRVPAAPSRGLGKQSVGGLALQLIAGRRRRQWPGALPCIGLAHAGHNTTEILARELTAAGKTGAGDLELVAHPGRDTAGLQAAYSSWKFDWRAEQEALLSDEFGRAVRDSGYEIR